MVKARVSLTRETARTKIVFSLLRIAMMIVLISGALMGIVLFRGSPDGQLVKDYLAILFPATLTVLTGATIFYFGIPDSKS